MKLPQINRSYVSSLIERAETKLHRFEERVSRLDEHIKTLEKERDSVSIILEHIGLSETREKLLLDLFVILGEYGLPEDIPEAYIKALKEHVEHMSSSIAFYNRIRPKRVEAIEFIKMDIKRLKKISTIYFQDRLFFLCVRDL